MAEEANQDGGVLAPRLVISFRGPVLGAVVLGDRLLCLVQDFYFCHWKDVWIFEHDLADGSLRRAVLIREGHDHSPRRAPFDVAGDIAVAPVEHPYQAYRLSTGDPIRLDTVQSPWLLRAAQPARAALVLAGGGRVIVHEREEILGVWDVSTGARVAEIRERMGPIQAVAMDRAGERLAIATSSRLRLWDLGQPKAIRSIGELSGRTKSLTFRPDGRAIVSCEADGAVRSWPLHRRGRRGLLPIRADRIVFDDGGARFVGARLEPSSEHPTYAVAALQVFDTRSRARIHVHPLPGLFMTDGSTPQPIVLTSRGMIVQQGCSVSRLEPATRAAVAPPAAPDLLEDVPADPWTREDPDGLQTFGVPVALWRAGEADFRRVTHAELRAAWRRGQPARAR